MDEVLTEKGYDAGTTPPREGDGAPDVSSEAVEQAAEAQAKAAPAEQQNTGEEQD